MAKFCGLVVQLVCAMKIVGVLAADGDGPGSTAQLDIKRDILMGADKSVFDNGGVAASPSNATYNSEMTTENALLLEINLMQGSKAIFDSKTDKVDDNFKNFCEDSGEPGSIQNNVKKIAMALLLPEGGCPVAEGTKFVIPAKLQLELPFSEKLPCDKLKLTAYLDKQGGGWSTMMTAIFTPPAEICASEE